MESDLHWHYLKCFEFQNRFVLTCIVPYLKPLFSVKENKGEGKKGRIREKREGNENAKEMKNANKQNEKRERMIPTPLPFLCVQNFKIFCCHTPPIYARENGADFGPRPAPFLTIEKIYSKMLYTIF